MFYTSAYAGLTAAALADFFLISDFDFDFDTAGEFEFHEGVDGFGAIVDFDVHQAFVGTQFELFAGLFVDEGRAVDGENLFVGRQWDGAGDNSARHFDGLDDLLGGFVDEVVIVRFQFDSNSLTHGFDVLV